MAAKILRVVPTLNVGGAEQGVKRIVERLDPERFKVKVCCLFEMGPLGEALKAAGKDVMCLNARPHPYGLTAIRGLVPVMREYQPDIMHAHLDAGNIAGPIAAWLVGVPAIVTNQHNSNPYRGRLIRLMDRLLALVTDRIVSVSHQTARLHATQSRISSGKYYIVHSTVNVSDFPFRSQRGDCEFLDINGSSIVGSVARLSRQKGQVYLLRAFAWVLDRFPDAHLLMVGDGPLRTQLVEEVQRLGIADHVTFTGRRSDVPCILQCLDVFAMSSLWEGCGTAPLEAMSVGVPVVLTPVGGVPEMVIPDETGLLVPPKDPEALASGIVNILDDPASARTRALAARKRVEEHFSAEAAAAKTMSLYEELLAER